MHDLDGWPQQYSSGKCLLEMSTSQTKWLLIAKQTQQLLPHQWVLQGFNNAIMQIT
jgi:hypothetical protein